jgi:hypothetical protein
LRYWESVKLLWQNFVVWQNFLFAKIALRGCPLFRNTLEKLALWVLLLNVGFRIVGSGLKPKSEFQDPLGTIAKNAGKKIFVKITFVARTVLIISASYQVSGLSGSFSFSRAMLSKNIRLFFT